MKPCECCGMMGWHKMSCTITKDDHRVDHVEFFDKVAEREDE